MNKQAYEASVARVLNKRSSLATIPLTISNIITRPFLFKSLWGTIKDIFKGPKKQLPDVYYNPTEPGRQIYKR